jgi:hypothetical protein
MKKLVIIFSCAVTLFSYAQPGSMRPAHFSFNRTEASIYEDFNSPVVIPDSAYVFASPDSSTQVLRTLHRADGVYLIGYGKRDWATNDTVVDKAGTRQVTINYHLDDWYRIDLGEKVGYVRASVIATNSFSGAKNYNYFIQASYVYPQTHAWGSMIYKYDIDKHQYTDTMFLEGQNFRKAVFITSDWANVNALFSATTINAYCGGGTNTIIITDVGGKLKRLISSGTAYEEMTADGEETRVWLPVHFGKSKIRHIINGDARQVIDDYTGDFQSLTIPAEIQIPRGELAILERTIHKGFLNKTGEPLTNPNGSYKEAVRKVYEYYRWNGSILRRIK